MTDRFIIEVVAEGPFAGIPASDITEAINKLMRKRKLPKETKVWVNCYKIDPLDEAALEFGQMIRQSVLDAVDGLVD